MAEARFSEWPLEMTDEDSLVQTAQWDLPVCHILSQENCIVIFDGFQQASQAKAPQNSARCNILMMLNWVHVL